MKVEDILPEQTINYKTGDKCAIDFGEICYALKDLVVKMYEENQELKARIEKLEATK